VSVNLNALTIEKLNEALLQIDDLEVLRTAAAKETRVSAKKLFEERIAALQNTENQSQKSQEPAPAPQEAPEADSPVEKVGKVFVKLVRGRSYRGRGIILKQDEVRAVSSDIAQALLETGLFEEVV